MEGRTCFEFKVHKLRELLQFEPLTARRSVRVVGGGGGGGIA